MFNGFVPLNIYGMEPTSIKEHDLIAYALDVARSSGAEYADARLTHSFGRRYPQPKQVIDFESITVGIRCLVKGYWGFASGPVWNKAELERLAMEAVAQATVNSLGKPRECRLVNVPIVKDGSWVMPVEIDPFTVHPIQVQDLLMGLSEYAKRRPDGAGASLQLLFQKQNKFFGSTDGSFYSQTTYTSQGAGGVNYQDARGNRTSRAFSGLSPAGKGFEILNEKNLREQVDYHLDDIRRDSLLPVIPVDVGRYDTMFSANVVSDLISSSIGAATEIDRALGYEANAGGTSYINEPEEMLGQMVIGSSLLSITGNRSMSGGAATVKWDDEGVSPNDFTLIRDGVLADLQTGRESAEWLRKQYEGAGREVRSNGCTYATGGVDAPLVRCANLVMKPGADSDTEDSLRESIADGIEVRNANVGMDFQQLNGWLGAGQCYEIKKGKRTSRVIGAGSLFRAPELWKSLVRIGNESTGELFGKSTGKGQPSQVAIHSVRAVPAICEKVSTIDVLRKA